MSETDDKVYIMVYINDGKTIIRKGRFSNGKQLFIPEDDPKTVMTQNPLKPLRVKNMKVYVESEEDIWKAKFLLKQRYEDYVERCKHIYEKALTADILRDKSINTTRGILG